MYPFRHTPCMQACYNLAIGTQKTELSKIIQELASAFENLAIEFALLALEYEAQASSLKRKL